MSQALEVSTWGALLRATRGVLAGDHLQLPPTIISEVAARRVCYAHCFCGKFEAPSIPNRGGPPAAAAAQEVSQHHLCLYHYQLVTTTLSCAECWQVTTCSCRPPSSAKFAARKVCHSCLCLPWPSMYMNL